MDTSKGYTTLVSFCTGIRGIERGIERVISNLRTICCVEREAFIIENLVSEMEAGMVASCPIWPDVTNFPAEHFRGMVDIFTGGYPCQGESVAGKRLGEDDPRWLWKYFERAIDIIQPRICFFENTRGHVTKGLPTVIASLECLGYRVHWGIFSAEETGASHKRERVFIMAIKEDCLDNTSSNGFESDDKISTRRNSAELTSKLADTNNRSIINLARGNEKNGEGERLQQWDIDKKFSKSSQLGNPSCKFKCWQWERIKIEKSQIEIGRSSDEKMDYTTESRFQKSRQGGIGEFQEKEGERLHDRLEQPSSFELGNTDNSGLQRRDCEICGECSYKWITRANGPFARGSVARPGQPQHEWEEPTTAGYIDRLPNSIRSMWSSSRKDFAKMLGEKIWEETDFRIKAHFERTVGMSAHELRLREDFLRALGNSVYADCAELAWITLMNKFL